MTMTQVNLSEVARRIGLSRQRVRQLVDEDPKFPRPEWVGNAWVVDWAKVQRWNAARDAKPGRPRRRRPDSDTTSDGTNHQKPPRQSGAESG
jgi:predicted DNA-binding transcriptional regulator AlpA